MLPAMADAQVVHQTACLRPLASDGLLLLGRVPGLGFSSPDRIEYHPVKLTVRVLFG